MLKTFIETVKIEFYGNIVKIVYGKHRYISLLIAVAGECFLFWCSWDECKADVGIQQNIFICLFFVLIFCHTEISSGSSRSSSSRSSSI